MNIKSQFKNKNKIIKNCSKYIDNVCGWFKKMAPKKIISIVVPLLSIIISIWSLIYNHEHNNKVFVNSIMPYLVLKDINTVDIEHVPPERLTYCILCDDSYYQRAADSTIKHKFFKVTLSNIGNGNLKNLAVYDFNTARKALKSKVKNVGSSLHEDNILSFTTDYEESKEKRNYSSFYLEKDSNIDIYVNCLYSNKTDEYLDFASIIIYQDLYDNTYIDYMVMNTPAAGLSDDGFCYGFFKDEIRRDNVDLFTTSFDSKQITNYIIENYKDEYKN